MITHDCMHHIPSDKYTSYSEVEHR